MEFNTHSDCCLHEASSTLTKMKNSAIERKVTFYPTCTVRTPTCRSITDEEKIASYYTKEELRIMKRDSVNGLLQTLSERPDSIHSDTAVTNTPTDTPRGLELILDPQRRKNRQVVQKSIIRYQMILNAKSELTDEQRHVRLAHITAKLNRWTSHVAFQTAWRDACDAVDIFPNTSTYYHSSDNVLMSTTPSTISHCEVQFAETDMESCPVYWMENGALILSMGGGR